MTTHYRTIVPNGHGGGTTYRDHIVNPATREDAYAVAARIPGAYVQSSPNGVTGWQDDAENNGETVERPTPAPISSQAGLASIRGGLPLATLHAVTARNVAAGNVIVEQPAGHAHTAAYQGLCTGECGV